MKGGVRKGTALFLVLLLLGYYQRWLYVPLLEKINSSWNNGVFEDALIDQEERTFSLKLRPSQLGKSSSTRKGRPPPPTVDPLVQKEADQLSELLQRRLEDTQRGQNLKLLSRGCKGPKLLCGSPIDCGLGCQIRYVRTCVMIADFLNRTLVLDWTNWPYHEVPWNDMFLPIGLSECPLDNETARVLWTAKGIQISFPEMKSIPYNFGVPVSKEFRSKLKHLRVSNRVLWWNGQYSKFVVRFEQTEEQLLKKLSTALKMYLPTVGVLKRKRDKIGERKLKINPPAIDNYMSAAKKYFSKLELLLPLVTRRVYVGTDERNILELIRRKYRPPKWEILGIQLKTDVEDLLKDLFLLTQCDLVICSFTSDICRLVLELKESNSLNSVDRVKAVDQQKYLTSLPGFKKLNFTLFS